MCVKQINILIPNNRFNIIKNNIFVYNLLGVIIIKCLCTMHPHIASNYSYFKLFAVIVLVLKRRKITDK